MLWYWAKLDTSTALQKTLWFIFFLVTGFFGTAIYSIAVYRRQVSGQIVAGD
jgi:NADH:ubiquinone oxidoreductase subunit 4 (subunit M)